MADYLLEIGVEELPYGLIDSITEQIKDNFDKRLAQSNTKYSEIQTYTTPRRLTFIIKGLEEVQEDITKVFRGPCLNVAKKDGNFTPAAEGFARKYGLTAEQLEIKEENGTEYVFATVHEKGKAITEVIPAIVNDCVLKVQGNHFMRWAELDEKFSRPIRWIVSILDNKELPIEITKIKSSKISRAHRFASEIEVEINSVSEYSEKLYAHNVIVDETKRKEIIVSKVNELAATIGGTVKIEDELLKEVTNIVEWPCPVVGNFDEKYLQIPEAVIVTVMASHQRYFPVYDKNGKLMNCFITVANYVGNDLSNIKNGNERVIKARLDDAIFFYNEDMKKPLAQKVDALKGMTFQKGLGTLFDKMERMKKLSIYMLQQLDLEEKYSKTVERTAMLAKADLTTSLVFEFTELQGVIGEHYARMNGEDTNVAQGIMEHYYPVVADAELAQTVEGQIVGIADKIDTICAVFVLNKIPTGSADPLGVRRATVGILQTIMQKNIKLNLIELIEQSLKLFNVENDKSEKLKNDVSAFIIQRLKGILTNKYPQEYVEAVLESTEILNNVYNIENKIKTLVKMSEKPVFNKIVESHTRIHKLVKDVNETGINADLFNFEEEKNLYKFLIEINNTDKSNSEELFGNLEKFVPLIENFFDKVLVMDKDENVKTNRLNLLNSIDKEFLMLADFTKIIK